MASLFGRWWPTETEKMDALHDANELLLEERTYVLDQQHKLRTQNKDQADKILKLESEALQHKNLIKRINAKNDMISKLQREAVHYRNLNKQINAKDSKIHELLGEITQYKKSISSSTMRLGQLSDASIQGAMDGLFYAVQDWAIETVRQEKTILENVAKERVEWLHNQIPGGKDGSSTRKVHALVALFSDALCVSMNQGWVFGIPTQGAECPLGAANFVHASLSSTQGLAPEKRKQWILLTNELLSKNEDVMKRSLKDYVEMLVAHVGFCLGGTPIALTAVVKLGSAIRQHIPIIQALTRQEADYSLYLWTAAKDGRPYMIKPEFMEDINGEERGALESMIFPALVKESLHEGNAKAVRTIICKSKVAVKT